MKFVEEMNYPLMFLKKLDESDGKD